ncbi:hypothetical protein LTS09_005133 [Friedmanniomyces endolithicus]|nr:hypothetical protein LTS09_005133 [Friedmanniomyces endolithicus]KAK0829962.1 hypothetical protein LTR73_004099 [Friedmanniomyces endolithicus]
MALEDDASGTKSKAMCRPVCEADNTEHPLKTQNPPNMFMVRHMMVPEVDESKSRVIDIITSDSALSSGQEG